MTANTIHFEHKAPCKSRNRGHRSFSGKTRKIYFLQKFQGKPAKKYLQKFFLDFFSSKMAGTRFLHYSPIPTHLHYTSTLFFVPADTEAITDKMQDLAAEDDMIDAPAKATALIESSHDVVVTLADPNADPKAALYAATTFEDLKLRPELLKGIYAMGYKKPSKIQAKALPLLMSQPYVCRS